MTAIALDDVLAEAARVAGIDQRDARLVRNGSNAIYVLRAGIVARVGRPGQGAVAAREVQVSRWLRSNGVAATSALPGVPQPTLVGVRPVTWWRELPPHRAARPAELGSTLRTLHGLGLPDFDLPPHDPLDGLSEYPKTGSALDEDDRQWLNGHLRDVRSAYSEVEPFRSKRLIHGDAWQGNLAVPDDGQPILLDFERVAVGDPAWDLLPVAVDHTDFNRIPMDDYRRFVYGYGGLDVVEWSGYRRCAEIQELRWLAFALSKADDDLIRSEVRHRLACLRGDVPKPWSWHAL